MLVRPLVVWIWIGGFVIVLGTLVAILPIKKVVAVRQDSSVEEIALMGKGAAREA